MTEINNGIFSIKNLTHSDGNVNAGVVVNENSDILKGHFPGQPVVPGACMLQLVKEVLERSLEHKIQLKKADNIKFMSMIVPGGQSELQLIIYYKFAEDGANAVQASLRSEEAICFKFQGSFEAEKLTKF